MSCLWIKNSFICRHRQYDVKVNASNKNGTKMGCGNQSVSAINYRESVFCRLHCLDTDYSENSWQSVKGKMYLNYPNKWNMA